MCPVIEKLLSNLSPKNREKWLKLLNEPQPIYHELYTVNGKRVYGAYWVEYPKKNSLGNVNEYFYKDK